MDDFGAYVGVIDQVQMDCVCVFVCVCIERRENSQGKERGL